jgi:hypothetical protein
VNGINGNLYELEHRDDFLRERLDFIGVESLSKLENKADLKLAIDHIAANLLYTCPPANNDHAGDFSIDPVDSSDAFTFSGYFKLSSRRTNQRATFGLDITPAGRSRVHLEAEGSDLYLY